MKDRDRMKGRAGPAALRYAGRGLGFLLTLAAGFLLGLRWAEAVSRPAALNVAYVDRAALRANAPRLKAAREAHARRADDRRRELRESFEREAEKILGDAEDAMEMEARREQLKDLLQSMTEKAEADIQRDYDATVGMELNEMKAALEETGKTAGADAILSNEAVLYGGTDLTAKILERMKGVPAR